MDPISAFNKIRDIPYRIPLSPEEEDCCCGGKHHQLKDLLAQCGYESRYRICSFRWSQLPLPAELLAVPHEDMCTHVFLEVKIGGRWAKVDATWDPGLRSILPINDWDGHSDTSLAVPPIKIFSPEKSAAIMAETSDQEDLKINGVFYRTFNEWLEENRQR